jgi:hypothetical protein
MSKIKCLSCILPFPVNVLSEVWLYALHVAYVSFIYTYVPACSLRYGVLMSCMFPKHMRDHGNHIVWGPPWYHKALCLVVLVRDSTRHTPSKSAVWGQKATWTLASLVRRYRSQKGENVSRPVMTTRPSGSISRCTRRSRHKCSMRMAWRVGSTWATPTYGSTCASPSNPAPCAPSDNVV